MQKPLPSRLPRPRQPHVGRAGCDPLTLVFGKHTPSHLVDVLAMPGPLPKRHLPGRLFARVEDDLEDKSGVRLRRLDIATMPRGRLLLGLGTAQVLHHLRSVQAHEERKVGLLPWFDSHVQQAHVSNTNDTSRGYFFFSSSGWPVL